MSQKTSLYEEHCALGAKMVDFAGWDMPIQYKNLKEEVTAVRESVGVFDVSHMGEFFIEGKETYKFLDYLLPNHIEKAALYKAVYSPLLREDATIIDDLIVYKLSESKALICVNASNIEKDYNWISEQIKNFDCELSDHSEKYSLLALQGPESENILSQILDTDLSTLAYYGAKETKALNADLIIARTGYTGEDGFEVFASHETIKVLWKEMMIKEVKPCGLGARDVLRLEVCYPLYGHELSDHTTPYETGLKWTVKNDKKSYIGKEALINSTPKTKLIKIILDKGIPREGYQLENQDGVLLGEITSGTMSVVLKKGIAIARVDQEKFNKDDEVLVDIRGKKYNAQIVTKPFVSGGHK